MSLRGILIAMKRANKVIAQYKINLCHSLPVFGCVERVKVKMFSGLPIERGFVGRIGGDRAELFKWGDPSL